MKLEKVIDVIFKHFPDKIIIYLRDKELFNGDIKYFNSSTYLGDMNVYTYEYVNKDKNIMLIRVIEE